MKEIEFQEIMFYSHPVYKNYLASRCGKILSLKCNKTKLLKLRMQTSGYLFFTLCENKTKKNCYVSRYIYETFKGKIPVDKEVDHLDSNKFNNSISNLQLLSHTENVRKSRCKKVISFGIVTKEKKIFNSIKEAAEFYGIFSSNISAICRKKMKTSKSKKDGMKYSFYFKN